MKTIRIVDQISRMHFEERRQQHSRVVRQMTPASAFDLRQVRLADRTPPFLLDRANDFLLRHLTVQTAKRSLHLPEVSELFAKFHISISNSCIAICNRMQQKKNNWFRLQKYRGLGVLHGGAAQVHFPMACSQHRHHCDRKESPHYYCLQRFTRWSSRRCGTRLELPGMQAWAYKSHMPRGTKRCGCRCRQSLHRRVSRMTAGQRIAVLFLRLLECSLMWNSRLSEARRHRQISKRLSILSRRWIFPRICCNHASRIYRTLQSTSRL